jgi:hypothetical protein
VLCALLALACSHMSRIEPRKQEDGSYRVDCKESLARCLTAFERACPDGYEILRAHENKQFYGPDAYNQPVVTSEAVARCRKPGTSTAEVTSSGSAGAAPKLSSSTCVPGATQTCVGPGACRGGQQCLADGAAYGPCDCGAAATAAPTSPAPAADAGVTAPTQ